MKTKFWIFLRIVTLVALLTTGLGISARASGKPVLAETTAATFPVIADFEGGVPDGWFVYGDWGNITIDITNPTVPESDPLALPGQVGSNDILSVTADIPTWAGFGALLAPAQDWSDYDALSFWYYGENLNTTHEFEIQTVSGDDRRATFVDDFAGWRQIVLPFSTFGAGGAYDVSQADAWVFVLDGTVGSFKIDHLELVNLTPFADFEGGVPDGWFVYGDWGNITIDITNPTIPDSDPLALPGQIGSNDILSVTADVPTWAGFGALFAPVQDWSDMQGVSFWYYGENLNTTHEFEIQTVSGDDRRATFVDDFAGWRLITLPFDTFGTPPYDVSQVDAWVFVLDGTVGSFKIDYINVYGDAGNITLRTQFETAGYTVTEGDTATITVTLNMTATYPVTVSYATADGTAIAGVDYISTTGTLVFPPDTLAQSFTVATLDNDIEDGTRTVLLTLSDPVSVTLGALSQATLLIADNEAADLCRRFLVTVDDFEDGLLPTGQHGTIGIGFVTWSDGSPVSIITATVPSGDPLALPGQVGDNIVLQLDANIGSWGGLSHLFMNEAGDTWINEDWSRYAGISFWLYGEGDGTGLFFEIKDNRTGSNTQDDAEIWTYPFTDDVAGWRYIEIPFSDFTRKEIGNNAPNDGFGRTEVHGWAFGSLTTGGPQTLYLDNVALLERVAVVDDFESGLPTGFDAYGNGIGFVTWGDTWNGTTVAIANPLVSDVDPLALPCQTGDNHLLQLDSNVNGWAGVSHAFENEAVDTWITQDWSSYEGVSFWLYGTGSGVDLFFDVTDNRVPGSTGDTGERFTYAIEDNFTGWRRFTIPFSDFTRKDIGNGAPDDGFTLTEVHGWSFGSLTSDSAQTHYLDYVMLYGDARQLDLTVAFAAPGYTVTEGETANILVTLNYSTTAPVTVTYTTAESSAIPHRDFTPVSGTLVIAPGELTANITIPTIDNLKADGDKRVVVLLFDPEGAELGFQRRTVLLILDDDPVDPNLLDDFEGFHPFVVTGTLTLDTVEIAATDPLALPGQGAYEYVLQVDAAGAGEFVRTYPEGQDWSAHDGLSFWFHGTNSGADITVQLLDNQAASTAEVDPGDWVLAWSQEFDDPAGTAPDGNIWTHEIGDGALNEIVGWGNSELQYYTDSTDNAATDGAGNLKITLHQVDTDTSDLVCHYGMCEYTSARLISANKVEFAYGKIEARVQVPSGAGLWPAFWMLGTNIGEVGWPTCGEIDIMEYVGRIPNEIFGTLHGPGYSGGNAFGNTYDFGYPVADDYHTFAIEWAPDEIHWYVDDILYHSATPTDVAPNQWVYNHPFFIILNMAIGGNFGGSVDPALTYPKEMLVDYVRVYQAVDTAERFESTFTDDFTGWRKVFVPFTDFVRSAEQPEGAPDDGLTLTEVWGYGFAFPEESDGTFYLDQVRLDTAPAATIAVSPDALAETAGSGSTTVLTQTLTVSNTGDANLAWSITVTPTSATWLMFTIGESEQTAYLPGLNIVPGGHEVVTVYFDPTNLAPGEYTAYLRIASNDPTQPIVMIPVTFTIVDTNFYIYLPLVLRNTP